MPESEHSLPTRYDRLGDQIDGPVLDAIVVHPQSRGILSLPGEYSTDSRPPPAHEVKITGTDPDSLSVRTEQHQPGGPDHYVVNYDVWNHRDSLTFAKIVRTDLVGDPSGRSLDHDAEPGRS
jgi:hypothetical protein